MRPAVRLLALGLVAWLLLPRPALSWQTAHGAPDNSGAVDVATLPAKEPLPNAPRLGGIAPGAGPVIAGDGTVYVVNGRGRLMSFKPDGTPGWSRDIGSQGVLSSPALGTDGSIYVIGAARLRDHTVNPPTTKNIAELHKFSSGGTYLWHVPLPGAAGGLITSAPPNIWKVPGMPDVILVPTVFKPGNYQARLTAFSESGGVLADQVVTAFSFETTGGSGGISGWDIPCYLVTLGHHDCRPSFGAPESGTDPVHLLPEKMIPPVPAVAVFGPTGNEVPLVMMSDGFRDLVGYFFSGNALQERFRVHLDRGKLLSTPLAWPTGHAMISLGEKDKPAEVMFAGLNKSTIRAAGPFTWAAPTALGNSRFALVRRYGGVTVLRGASEEITVALPGESIASAAASRNHVFVSTASALHTFDKATMQEVAKFNWQRGGASPVAIGPQGHVYAIADDRLHVFPPALQVTGTPAPMPPPAPSTTQSPRYDPPKSKNGYRLFACLELDGDDCGKQDHREIAKLFCAKEGYGGVAKFDVDTKKTKAETLQGDEYCSKKKCKVFDEIVCNN